MYIETKNINILKPGTNHDSESPSESPVEPVCRTHHKQALYIFDLASILSFFFRREMPSSINLDENENRGRDLR